jgi:hypothetical protein
MDANIPTDITAVNEAIDALDKKFEELNKYKNDSKRTHTTEQIDEVIDLLDNTKKELQQYQEAIINDEAKIEQGKPTERVVETPTNEISTQAEAGPAAEVAPQTLPEVENAISNLRKQEQAENEETYNKYDEVITPLLEKEKELKAEAPVAEEAKGTSEQAPQAFPAQEGAESVEDKFKANPELEQIYRDLNAAVNKNIDPKTLEAVKRNPTLVMVEKALRELERKGVIKIDCN